MRYRAFISYSHADARRAAQLHRQLEGYRLPKRLRGGSGLHGPLPERLAPIFRDRDDLPSAGQLGPQIEAALAESEALVVVCSPAAARSAYVDAEIRAFKRLGRGERIYAYIVEGEPHAGGARECFPQALRHDPDPDAPGGERPANPVAADARPAGDGSALALLKLLAGLFGLPLDALRQREAQRRHRRTAAIAAVAVAVMLVTSVLALQATVARKAAERRQKQAEALVGFMLGDLNDRLSEVGRLDILSAVNDKAMAYFQSLPATDLTDESVEQRAKALVKIGSVRIEQGQLDAALESFRAAESLAAPLARAAPGNLARQLAHADILAFIGTTHWYRGDLAGAQRAFDAAHAVLAAARPGAPDDPQLLFQLSTVDNNNGHVLESRGQLVQATTRYRRMLDASRRLAALGPRNATWQQQLGLAHNNLAKMALLRGDLAGAIAGYRADVAIQAAMAARDPRNNAQRERVLLSRATLGRTLALAGALEEGSALQRQALDEAERLHAMEPASTAFQYDVGLYALQRAKVERRRGRAADAQRLVRRALEVLGAMVAANPDQPALRRDLAEAMTEQAVQRAARGDRGGATALLQPALEALAPQLAESPQERGTVLATVDAMLRLAALSDPAPRRRLCERALAAIEGQQSGRDDPRLLALRADALLQLGRRPEALAVAARLRRTGYRDPALADRLAAPPPGSPPHNADAGTPAPSARMQTPRIRP
jgi:tetratricopeptide (TPR) repeat protein